MGRGDTGINALVGAVVTVVTSFTVISPLIGGAVAGYLNQVDGAKAGALSGVIASIPILGFVFLAGSVLAVLPFVDPGLMGGAGGVLGLAGVVIAVFVFVVIFVVSAGLGALGGYIGQYLYDEDVV